MSDDKHEVKLSEFLSVVQLENGGIELRGYYDEGEACETLSLTSRECGLLVAYLEGAFA